MAVEQFDPNDQVKKSQSKQTLTQTTTLDTPSKVLAEQQASGADEQAGNSRIGFVSLGCPKP